MELVDRRDIRPQRPNIDEAPQITDGLWQLAESCWAKSPTARPNANGVCDTILHQLRDTTVHHIDAIDSPRPCASPTLGQTTIAVGNQNIPGTSGTLQAVKGGVQVIEEKVCGRH